MAIGAGRAEVEGGICESAVGVGVAPRVYCGACDVGAVPVGDAGRGGKEGVEALAFGGVGAGVAADLVQGGTDLGEGRRCHRLIAREVTR